jgi:hypothetical protein
MDVDNLNVIPLCVNTHETFWLVVDDVRLPKQVQRACQEIIKIRGYH